MLFESAVAVTERWATMSEDFDKSVRMEPFSGKQVDWQVCSEQFLARARRKGYKEILNGKSR